MTADRAAHLDIFRVDRASLGVEGAEHVNGGAPRFDPDRFHPLDRPTRLTLWAVCCGSFRRVVQDVPHRLERYVLRERIEVVCALVEVPSIAPAPLLLDREEKSVRCGDTERRRSAYAKRLDRLAKVTDSRDAEYLVLAGRSV